MSFVQFSEDEIPELLPLLESRFPESTIQLYNCVQLYLRCAEGKASGSEFKFFRFNGLPLPATSILSQMKIKESPGKVYWIFAGPSSDSVDELSRILSALESLVDWSQRNTFNAIDERFAVTFRSMCLQHDPGLEPNPIPHPVYWMRKDDALKLSVQESDAMGEVRELSDKDLETVMKYWKYAPLEGSGLVSFGMHNVGSAGLWVGDKLVSFVLGMPDGAIHALYTPEEYRRKGYGRIVAKFLTKLLAQRGFYPIGHVEHFNPVAASFWSGIGFKLSHYMRWAEAAAKKT